jgi:hypothetical protein
LTVGAKEIEQLMKGVEGNPRTEYTVDLEQKTISYGSQRFAIDLPHTYCMALTHGTLGFHCVVAGQSRSGKENRGKAALYERVQRLAKHCRLPSADRKPPHA